MEGFFEFVVLQTMGDQFYLYWHSGASETQVVYNRARLWEIVNGHPGLPYGAKLRARTLNVNPVVKEDGDTVSVEVVTFSDWGGFVQKTYTISQDFPHKVLEIEHTIVAAFGWSLYDIDRTDVDSLLPFLFHKTDAQPVTKQRVYCDQVDWL